MTTGTVNYRNGTNRSSLRTQSSASTSGGQKPTLKSKSVLRKSIPASLCGGSAAASKSGSGGEVPVFLGEYE
ncbi:unnamed protein product [Microthlaspi erraticum]|uniref:Uncharacterized protein n=1 Tax=Microthlaspi erraticum TaxID=1685480 RepID=A0A6D2JE04_9BRAS|nr:unnamed protein product [Microthlaspi erraticum]